MASEFITRVERGKDEPYTVIFRTDDADKYKHIEDECRRMIGHEMPTVDAVPVVRCGECKHGEPDTNCIGEKAIRCEHEDNPYGGGVWLMNPKWFCADGERRTE